MTEIEMRKSVFIESSIISYLASTPSRDVVNLARQLIQKTVEASGFTCPTICTPEQLYTEGMEDDAILKELRENRKAIAENRAAQPSPPPSP